MSFLRWHKVMSKDSAPWTWWTLESSLEILFLESHCWAQHCSHEALEIKNSVVSSTRTQLAFWPENWQIGEFITTGFLITGFPRWPRGHQMFAEYPPQVSPGTQGLMCISLHLNLTKLLRGRLLTLAIRRARLREVKAHSWRTVFSSLCHDSHT